MALSRPLLLTRPRVDEDRAERLLRRWERSAALSAPVAPADGALAPNQTGYLLGRGQPGQRILPRAAAWARLSPAVTVPALMLLPFLVVPTPYGPGGAAVLSALAVWGPIAAIRRVGARKLARHLQDAPLVDSARPVEAGTAVRLRGVVVGQQAAVSLFQGRAAVMARSESAGASETRGIDFSVRLATGETVFVPARDTLLVGETQRVRGRLACGPIAVKLADGEPRFVSALLSVRGWFSRLGRLPASELTIAPGEEVELCGSIGREPDPDAEGSGFGRAPGYRSVLRPAGAFPALVRKMADPDASSSQV